MASVLLIGFYIVAGIFITVAGLLYIVAPKLPQVFQDLFLYGKARGKRKEKTIIQKLEVPKQWFTHYYVVGVICQAASLYIMVSAYLYKHDPPEWFQSTLNYVSEPRTVTTDASSAILVVTLMFIQNGRRLLECIVVSVYSKSTMNVSHYLLGLVLYSTFSFAVLAEAPKMTTHTVGAGDFMQIRHLLGVAVFFWATLHHHHIHEIFGDLRKDKHGKVSSYGHHIPQGDWFQYVSCPHYLAEMLIYLSFQIVVGWDHLTVLSISLFVWSNQCIAGYITHSWYLKQFGAKYPKERTAVIPYLL